MLRLQARRVVGQRLIPGLSRFTLGVPDLTFARASTKYSVRAGFIRRSIKLSEFEIFIK